MIHKISISLCLVALYLLPSGVQAQKNNRFFTEDYIRSAAQKVCDWQFNHLHTVTPLSDGGTEPVPPTGWIRGVFYTGVIAAYRTTGHPRYLDSAYQWAEQNRWQLGDRKMHADDQVVAQTYADLYGHFHQSQMIEPASHTYDQMISSPHPGPITGWSKSKNWSWCDALYMAPPAMAKLSHFTSNSKYLYLMNTMWWETYHHLFSEEDSLFYRDQRYVIQPDGSGRRTASGKKVFWGRGNGWVLAGLAKLIQWLPADYATRPAFEEVFKAMATKIASLQGEDGLWRSSLYDPEEYPAPEASSSGFFCYGLAWGINNGLLPAAEFAPVVRKAWTGLNQVLHDSGKLGYVQQVGHDPRSVSMDDSMEYGAAAYLLSAEQILNSKNF